MFHYVIISIIVDHVDNIYVTVVLHFCLPDATSYSAQYLLKLLQYRGAKKMFCFFT